MQEREERELAATLDLLNPPAAELVRLRAGGRVFEVARAAVMRTPSLLARLVCARRSLNKDESGAIVLAVDAASLELIIMWLNTRFLPVDLTKNQHGSLVATATALGMDTLVHSLARPVPVLTQTDLMIYLGVRRYLAQADIPNQFCGFNLSGVQFGDLNMRKWSFDGATLHDCNFQGANLTEASFKRALLCGADFRNTTLIGAQFQGSDLRGANLSNTYLSSVQFQDADLRNAILRNVTCGWSMAPSFQRADMTGAIVSPPNMVAHAIREARLPPKMYCGCGGSAWVKPEPKCPLCDWSSPVCAGCRLCPSHWTQPVAK